MIVIGNPEHGEAIARAARTTFHPTDIVIANEREGNLLGGVIYTGYTGPAISMHVAAFTRQWITPNMLFCCFDYPFNQLGCNKLIGQVPEGNLTAVAFDKAVGFVEETRVKDVFPDGDMLVLTMYKKDCRYLKIRPRNLEADILNYGEIHGRQG